jgi:hypothetical protein
MRHSPEALAAMVKEDLRQGLVTVMCPKCGITAGVLPNSDTWHAPCGGIRMRPVDPQAAQRLKTAARVRRHRAARQLRDPAESVTAPKSDG